ncbi:MAG: hypothetical protein ACJ72H_30910 [Candidatus Sulfotelmatobacter sp.]
MKRSMFCLLAFAMLAVLPNTWAQNRPAIAEQIAKTYGLDSFGQIDAIRYTLNTQFPGVNLSRSWVWEPKTNKISYAGKDKSGKPVEVTYQRSQVGSQSDAVKQTDSAFNNDQYWLLFPFHVYWDSSANVKDMGMQKSPLAKGSARQVVVKYPAEAGGYTPGDTWELYVGKDNRVEQFVYHRGGSQKPSVVIATWAGYKKAGPLLISTEHRGTADGKPFHLFFSNVAVKLAGSDKWVDAQ